MCDGDEIKLIIWNSLGHCTATNTIKGSQCFVFTLAPTKRWSNLDSNEVPVLLLGNKYDLFENMKSRVLSSD